MPPEQADQSRTHLRASICRYEGSLALLQSARRSRGFQARPGAVNTRQAPRFLDQVRVHIGYTGQSQTVNASQRCSTVSPGRHSGHMPKSRKRLQMTTKRQAPRPTRAAPPSSPFAHSRRRPQFQSQLASSRPQTRVGIGFGRTSYASTPSVLIVKRPGILTCGGGGKHRPPRQVRDLTERHVFCLRRRS